MKLANYFDKVKGFGTLSTADSKGNINAWAISKPFVVDEDTVAFVMTGNLTHKNLQSNPHAAYFFLEKSEKYDGVRLLLTKVKKLRDMAVIEEIRKKRYPIFTTITARNPSTPSTSRWTRSCLSWPPACSSAA